MTEKELYTKLYNQLPNSWHDITLADYNKLINCKIHEAEGEDGLLNGIHNTIEVISKLTNTDRESIEGLSMIQITALANKLDFITSEIDYKNIQTNLKWKTIDKITMDNYIQFIQTENHLMNLKTFIKSFSLNEFTDEQIEELPIDEVMSGFFLFRKQLMKSLKASAKSIKRNLFKQKIKQIPTAIWHKITKPSKDKSISN